MVGCRTPKNLKVILVKAKIPIEKKQERDIPNSQVQNKCKNKNCTYCPLVNRSGCIKSHYTDREYCCKKNVGKSGNLIYCIECKKCGMQYVGQTKNRLMDRFQAHFQTVKSRNPQQDISRHFNKKDYNLE